MAKSFQEIVNERLKKKGLYDPKAYYDLGVGENKQNNKQEPERPITPEPKSKKNTDADRNKRIAEAEAYIKEREKLASAAGITSKRAGEQLAAHLESGGTIRGYNTDVYDPEAEARLNELLSRTGALKETLTEQTTNPPDITPKPLFDASRTGLDLLNAKVSPFIGKDLFNVEAFAKTKLGKAINANVLAFDVAAGIAAATILSPAIVTAASSSALSTSILGSAFSLKGATGALTAFFGAREIFNFRGKEMDTHRTAISKVVEGGERIEASVRNGTPPSEGIKLLEIQIGEVDEAERVLKQLGNYNLDYRYSKEYISDMTNIRNARVAIERRIRAIENIAISGQGAYSPEELMYLAANEPQTE